ncbi:hypothetical protein [Streptomyces sp. NPDC053431]|uniref:hypothetical protein n=1 Tax=Streptomyces sp. NPDC053431 TaxID=3365703 RepID=UPI0037D09954
MAMNDLDAPVSGGWVAPLVSTVITLPLGFLTLAYTMLSPMACDSCDGADADRFDASFAVAFPTAMVGLLVSLVLLITSWALPRNARNVPRRIGFALAAPLTVVVTAMLFAGLLQTP